MNAGWAERTSPPHAFPKHLRLLRRADFRRVYEKGQRRSASLCTVFYCPNGLAHSRLGITVPVRVGKAVTRNRIKRRLREIFRLNRPAIALGRLEVDLRCCLDRRRVHAVTGVADRQLDDSPANDTIPHFFGAIVLERSGRPSPAFVDACARVLAAGRGDPAFAAGWEEAEEKAADALEATAYLVDHFGRHRPPPADVRDERGDIVHAIHGPMTREQDCRSHAGTLHGARARGYSASHATSTRSRSMRPPRLRAMCCAIYGMTCISVEVTWLNGC